MKRLIAGTILAFPLAVTCLATQANASEIFIQPGNSGHWENGTHGQVWVAKRRQVWVPGHWDITRYRRVWVPGHYEYR